MKVKGITFNLLESYTYVQLNPCPELFAMSEKQKIYKIHFLTRCWANFPLLTTHKLASEL